MRKIILFFLAAFCGALLPSIAEGQVFENVHETTPEGRDRYVLQAEWNVYPKAIEDPPLKYRLHWGYDQRTDTNAALQYNLASQRMSELRYQLLKEQARKLEEDFQGVLTDPKVFAEKKAAWEKFERELAALPLDAEPSEQDRRDRAKIEYPPFAYSFYCGASREDFPMEDAKKFVEGFDSLFRLQLEPGSRCDYCDWEHSIRNNPHLISLLIPEVQEMRDLARGLQVKARYEIYSGQFEEAARSLRVGKALARHVSDREPILVTHLVSVAINGITNSCIQEFQQQPEAPNLYWSLTALPGTRSRFSECIEMEAEIIRAMIPELKKAMDEPEEMNEADWKSLEKSCFRFFPYFFEENISPYTGGVWEKPDVLSATANLSAYPKAKPWLLQQGRSSEEVENMSVAQVVGRWSVARYRLLYEGMLKMRELPYWQVDETELDPFFNELEKAAPLDMMVALLTPAFRAAHTAFTREQWSNDMLRIVEAIRDYAAKNNGRLPQSLEEITAVPIPSFDPFSGKPYEYTLRDGAAVIESASKNSQILRAVIRIQKSN